MKLHLRLPWRSPVLDCEAVMRQLWDYLDGEPTAERMEAIRKHVAMRARCYPRYDFEREFLAALARLRREHSNPGRCESGWWARYSVADSTASRS